jgi:DivIVA domain-containing protein
MAADKNSTEILPMLGGDEPFFDVGMRGYDKRQVDDYVAQITAEVAELRTARDAALATGADRAAQLANREAHIESLKRQATHATESINPANVSDRIRDMLQLATDEAAQTRRNAEEEADRVLAGARADAERVRSEAAAEQQRLTASAAQRSAEADQKLAQARTAAAAELEAARTEVARLNNEAAAERERLDAEAASARDAADRTAAERRQLADDDFEITLRSRRSVAERQAIADHERTKQIAVQMIEDARRQVDTLKTERAEIHESLRALHARLRGIVEDTSDA